MNTNDKHREIAEKWKLTTVNVKDYDDKLLAFIAEVDQEGYERGVRESAEKFKFKVRQSRCPSEAQWFDEILTAILSLLAPPVPVWCEHMRSEDGKTWYCYDSPSEHGMVGRLWTCCPICKADKPQGTK